MNRILTWGSLAAALGLTAQAEWELALAVGWWIWVAWLAPVSLDAYVIAAFRAGRDRTYALGLMSAAVFASHAVVVAFPSGLPWWITGSCSVLPPIVAWRIHELWRSDNPTVTVRSVVVDSHTQNAAPPLPPPSSLDDEAAGRPGSAAVPTATVARLPKRQAKRITAMSPTDQEVWLAGLDGWRGEEPPAGWRDRLPGMSDRSAFRRVAGARRIRTGSDTATDSATGGGSGAAPTDSATASDTADDTDRGGDRERVG